MHSRACFCKRFGSEHVNESQKLLNSREKYFGSIFYHSEPNCVEKGIFNQIWDLGTAC